jgi:subtilase family serine protease
MSELIVARGRRSPGGCLRSGLLASVVALALTLVVPGAALAQGGPHPGASGRFHRAVCGAAGPRVAHCLADVVTNAKGTPLATAATLPPGYGPSDLQNAYNLAQAIGQGNGAGKTVAIVDAYHDPNAAADLATYRSTYGLSACTAATGCFSQVNQQGAAGAPPATDASWSQEISLDLDMVSSVCPNCHILLVEANSASYANLGTAVNTAASLGASAISNSYGGSESLAETSYDSYYNHPGINVTVSSGDNGYGVEYPAASPYVTAVGGTSLSTTTSNTRGWSETAWSGAGSGCSAYESKPSWQTDAGCSTRTVADVSAVANPNTGVAVYDSLPYNGSSGWMVFGGTSVASPITASVDALSSTFRSLSFPYDNPSQFFDVVGGSNGSCSGSYLCTAVGGYDGPTGIGSPNGAGSVAPPTAPPANSAVPVITGSPIVGQTLTATTGTWSNSPTSYSYQWQTCNSTSGCTSVGPNPGTSTYQVQSSDVGNTIDVIVTATNSVGSTSAQSSSTSTVAAAPADFSISAPATASVRRNNSASLAVTVNPQNGYTSPTTMSVTGLPSGVSPTWSANPATPGQATTLKLTAGSFAQTGTFTLTIKGAAGTLSHTTTTRLTVTKH